MKLIFRVASALGYLLIGEVKPIYPNTNPTMYVVLG